MLPGASLSTNVGILVALLAVCFVVQLSALLSILLCGCYFALLVILNWEFSQRAFATLPRDIR